MEQFCTLLLKQLHNTTAVHTAENRRVVVPQWRNTLVITAQQFYAWQDPVKGRLLTRLPHLASSCNSHLLHAQLKLHLNIMGLQG